MNMFAAALWAEMLKSRRSKVPIAAAAGYLIAPLVGGLFMIILKDPEAARSMGLISTKAQFTAGTADWPGFFNLLAQAVPVGGAILFSILTAWCFGREFSDHTLKELLALPTSRSTIVSAKFAVIAIWTFCMSILVLLVGFLVGWLVDIPGWSIALARTSLVDILGAALFTICLLPFVALAASAGGGYMPAFGWTILMVALAQVSVVMGWGDWFPWAIPALFAGAIGPRAEQLGPHSYLLILLAGLVGLAATLLWWQRADHTR
jgi:ABC-2 type transport system permease protein